MMKDHRWALGNILEELAAAEDILHAPSWRKLRHWWTYRIIWVIWVQRGNDGRVMSSED